MLRGEDKSTGSVNPMLIDEIQNHSNIDKQHSLEDLLEKASQLLEDREIEAAEKFTIRALESWGKNPKSLDLLANILLEKGDWEGAYAQFQEVLEITGSKGWATTHMSLGQMTTGLESASHYQKGIQLYLEQVTSNKLSEEELFDIKRKVSNGFVSLTELYLTDLCFEDDAENKCESYLSQAIDLDPHNPEVLQALASVRLSQNRKEDAQECLTKSFEMWYNQEVLPPPHAGRLALARIMIEAELYDTALLVLEHLEKEDDQEVDVWYLYGLVNFLIAKKDVSQPDLELCTEAWGCLAMALNIAEKQQFDDEEVLEHIKELQSELIETHPSLLDNLEEENQEGPIEEVCFPDTDDEEEYTME